MTNHTLLQVDLRHQSLTEDSGGYTQWQTHTAPTTLDLEHTALVLCDVWDRHWCRGANERLAQLLPRMSQVVTTLRTRGALIVHAPSETMPFYADTPARRRVLAAPPVMPPQPAPHDDPPRPIDASDEGCDTRDQPHKAWSCQHPAIAIDHERDAISDDGGELFNLYVHRHITTVVIMGVHTNMCVLHRSFAIKSMVRWGLSVVLIRDLTDAMYSPAMSPFVSHDEGNRLMVEFIEKFWCPSVSSSQLVL